MSPPKFVREGTALTLLPPLDAAEVAPETVDLTKPGTGPETASGTSGGDRGGRPPSAPGGTAETGPDGRRGPRGLPPLAGGPLVPDAYRDPRSTAAWAARYLWHILVFHFLRLPMYLGRTVGYAPRGVARGLARLASWATDGASSELMRQAVEQKNATTWLHVNKARSDKAKVRVPAAVALVGVVVALAVAGVQAEAVATRLGTVLAVLVGLGWLGRPMGEPFIPSAVVSDPAAVRFTPDQISTAFVKAKLATEKEPVAFFGKVHRDGAAWSVVVDLPGGRTASEAMGRRGALASALRVTSGRLFLSGDSSEASSDARVHLRIADRDPMTGPPVLTPLLRAQRTDVWSVLPFGLDERGRDVELCLMWLSGLFSGMPRTGKSFSLRLLALGVALDPAARIGAVFDAKASPDWRDFAMVAYRCGFDDGDETCRLLRDTLREFVREVTERNHAISRLPRSQAREGKLTQELARRFPVTLVILEECQDYFLHPKYGAEIKSLAIKLVKKGPSAGFIVFLSTQRPDADAVPPPVRSNFQLRFSLRLENSDAATMALGPGCRDRGFDPVTLSPHYQGVGYALGSGLPRRYEAGGTIVRCHFADGEHAETILLRARELRLEEGTLAGMAAGEEPEASGQSLLEDVAGAFAIDGADALWSHEIIDRLTQRHGGRYERWTPELFGQAVGRIGLETVQIARTVDGRKVNNRGLRRAAIADAVAAIQAEAEPEEEPDE